jgi:hypothetical protein
MLAGLGIPATPAPLNEDEEETLDEFFVFLSMAPSEYYALPEAKQQHLAVLFQEWHLTHLYHTRMTSAKK